MLCFCQHRVSWTCFYRFLYRGSSPELWKCAVMTWWGIEGPWRVNPFDSSRCSNLSILTPCVLASPVDIASRLILFDWSVCLSVKRDSFYERLLLWRRLKIRRETICFPHSHLLFPIFPNCVNGFTAQWILVKVSGPIFCPETDASPSFHTRRVASLNVGWQLLATSTLPSSYWQRIVIYSVFILIAMKRITNFISIFTTRCLNRNCCCSL